TCGITFALAQFVTSNYISTQLTDIVASLVSALAVVLLLRVWQPAEHYIEMDDEDTATVPSRTSATRAMRQRVATATTGRRWPRPRATVVRAGPGPRTWTRWCDTTRRPTTPSV